MPFELPSTVVNSTITASGQSAALQSGGGRSMNLLVNASAVTGTTPSMTVSVQWSMDGTTFGPQDGGAESFAALTAAGAVVKQLAVKAPFYRVAWSVSGTTPSFTTTVQAYFY